MENDTKTGSVLQLNGEIDSQVVDSAFAMVGQAALAEREFSVMPIQKVETPKIRIQPARVRQRARIDMALEEELPTWRYWIGKAMFIGGLVCAAYLILKAVPGSPLYDEPARSTPVANLATTTSQMIDVNIQNIKVGERVAGRNPLREQVDANAPEPEPNTWRKLVLRMKKASGRELRIELLRPVQWIDAANAKSGGTFFLNLPEMGAVGEARVDAIERCPPIKRGPGNVVTGTFHHEADPDGKILHVDFSNGSVIKGVTDNHPFWSEDRQVFVPIGELKNGERVRVNNGIAVVTSVSSRAPDDGEMLYNLEVHNEHVYQVATAGILVHNSCAPNGNAESLVKRFDDVDGGSTTVNNALTQGEKWLGKGYKEIAPGVFRSADGARQFRMTGSDLLDTKIGPHVHFESIASDGRTILENSHVKLLDP